MNLLYRLWDAWERFDPLQWLHSWTRHKLDERLLRERKTATICTWCNRNMQGGDGCSSEEFEHDEQFDVMECGHCGGTSLWVWGFGFQYVTHLDPPIPQFDPVDGSDELRRLYFGEDQNQTGAADAAEPPQEVAGPTLYTTMDSNVELYGADSKELEQETRS